MHGFEYFLVDTKTYRGNNNNNLKKKKSIELKESVIFALIGSKLIGGNTKTNRR